MKFHSGDFIGRDTLLKVKETGPQRLLVGIELSERGVPRGGYPLYDGTRRIGALTSGSYAPTLGKSIGMGYVEAAHATVGEPLQVEIRGKRVPACIVALPFYTRKKRK